MTKKIKTKIILSVQSVILSVQSVILSVQSVILSVQSVILSVQSVILSVQSVILSVSEGSPRLMYKLLFISFLFCFTTSFTFLSGPKKAKLPVTSDAPQATFYWDGNAPSIKDVDSFADGKYSGLDDEAVMLGIIQEAMNVWNKIPGSYLELVVEEATDEVDLDSDDEVNAIVVQSESNAMVAAGSIPNIEDSTIIDCDIKIPTSSKTAKALGFTMIHEFGHCIGLGHSHTNYNAAMGYARDTQTLTLGLDDMAGAMYLYPDPEYFDGEEPKELIACGTLSTPAAQNLGIFLLLLLFPIFMISYHFARKQD